MKLEMYNYFPDTTPHRKFQGLRGRGWSGQIASLTHESFCPFLVLAKGLIFGRTPRSIRHYASFWL